MSQNQSYFWQTTRRNVYLKRSAKLHMFLALLAVLTFSTVCLAEFEKPFDGSNDNSLGVQTKFSADADEKPAQVEIEKNGLPNVDATKDVPAVKTGFLDAFTASISVILVTELGDKTFFIAAIMAMRHPRLIVFSGAISALALMTVLSVFFGMAATIIPKVYTYYISTALFAIFGIKMIYEGYKMKPTDAQEELEEVQSDLRKREDELRLKRSKYEDAVAEGKRKNSNSDKDDDSSAGVAGSSALLAASLPKTSVAANPEMQHRQRKQPNNSSNNQHQHQNQNNNNNYASNNNNNNNNDDDSIGEFNEEDVFLESNKPLRKHESLKMSNFHTKHMNTSQSSPALSNQTAQTNCDDEFITNSHSNISGSQRINNNINLINNEQNTPNTEQMQKYRTTQHNNHHQHQNNGSMTMIHSSVSAAGSFKALNGSASSLNNVIGGSVSVGVGIGGGGSVGGGSIQSIHSNAAGSITAGLDGNKRRLERNANAPILQDPESGLVRKNSKKSATYLTTRVFMQAFTMTFLAEWGDRSQLTTIILGASKNVYGVITGGIIGHSICTGLAVIGGRIVAAKISVRTVTIVGGIVFLCFALYALLVRPDDI